MRSTCFFFFTASLGLILVHDLTNKKSHENLRKWLSEVLCKDCPSKKTNGLLEFDQEMFADSQVPILVVATKVDLVPQTAGRALATVAEECGTDQVLLDNNNPKSLAPGSSNALKVTRFLDKVVERRFRGGAGSPPVSAAAPVVDRRRAKLSHLD
ncbi:hypothetical protein V5799_000485 [Amblyomma americanum]|uniref:Uncharacterized protein n=1 Tax=Amblyomma americanum TaxID=6943 RepID=A0AAQ4D2X9_AMBAM